MLSTQSSSSTGSDAESDDVSESSSKKMAEPDAVESHTNQKMLDAFYKSWREEVACKSQPNNLSNSYSHSSHLSQRQRPQSPRQPLSNSHLGLTEHFEAVSALTFDDTGSSSTCDLTKLFHRQLFDEEDSPGVYCEPELAVVLNSVHISALPAELLLLIFRWVIGTNLDIRSVERLACVCRGFYLLSRDASLWRSICIRLWSSSLLLAVSSGDGAVCSEHPVSYMVCRFPSDFGYPSWREMALLHPHVLLDGCYLCRVSYVRPGEAEFGASYRPIFLVVYYRGLRFHADGCVEMLTAATSGPAAIVTALGGHLDSIALLAKEEVMLLEADNCLLVGTYQWCDPHWVTCRFRRRSDLTATEDAPTNRFRRRRHARLAVPPPLVTYEIRFKLCNSKRKMHNILRWDSYTIHTLDRSTGLETSTELNLRDNHFPPCYFSHVRSYIREPVVAPV